MLCRLFLVLQSLLVANVSLEVNQHLSGVNLVWFIANYLFDCAATPVVQLALSSLAFANVSVLL